MRNCWPCQSAAETGRGAPATPRAPPSIAGTASRVPVSGGRQEGRLHHRLSDPTNHRSDILRGDTKNAMAKHTANISEKLEKNPPTKVIGPHMPIASSVVEFDFRSFSGAIDGPYQYQPSSHCKPPKQTQYIIHYFTKS